MPVSDDLNAMLRRVLERMVEQPMTLHLYTLDERGNLEELSGGGYRSVPISITEWTIPPIAADSRAMAEGPVVEFRFDGLRRHKVIGSYLTRDRDNQVVWLRPFDNPLEVGRRGDIIPVRPVVVTGPLKG